MRSRAAGLLLGHAADRLLRDPRRLHPVAGFGQMAGALERDLYADSRARGVLHTGVLVGGAVLAGALAERVCSRPVPHLLLTAAATWAVLGGGSLEHEATVVQGHLVSGDLSAARQRLTHLVGRDTSELDAPEIARAVVESVAENTSDAVVAPLVWGALAGVPGLLGYRAANTLDAMVGHRSARYQRFGWASARLDDLLNLPGSRLSGLLVLVADHRHAAASWRTWRADGARHPSPNAGVVEAAFAGALGVRLGGTNHYPGGRVEHRAVLGAGRVPGTPDIGASTRLARRVGLWATGVCGGVAVLLSRPRP